MGLRPADAVNRKRSSRLRRRTEKGSVVNVIAVARQYEAFLSKPDVLGFRQVAEHFGITKATVSYYLAFLNRLPVGFVDWLEACNNPMVLAFFGQKRLRAIISMNEAEQARAIVAEARKLLPDLEDGESADVLELLQALGRSPVPGPRPREQRAIVLD